MSVSAISVCQPVTLDLPPCYGFSAAQGIILTNLKITHTGTHTVFRITLDHEGRKRRSSNEWTSKVEPVVPHRLTTPRNHPHTLHKQWATWRL